MQTLKTIAAMVFLILFAAVWIWIGWRLWHFTPTTEHAKLDLNNDWVGVAGFLASGVAAGTAAVLGIEIKRQTTTNIAGAVANAARSSIPLLIGIVVYAAVGLFVAAIWFGHTDEAPDMIRAFSWGVIGWLGGAFSSVFH